MTREDVLSGLKFKWNSSVYAASPDKNGDYLGGSLLLCIGNAQIYECNVSSFGPYAMHWFTYVMGRQVKGRISYKHLEPHIEAPQAIAA